MDSEGFQNGFRFSLRLGEVARTDLLDRLDRFEQHETCADCAPHLKDQVKFRTNEVALTVEHPGGGLGRFFVCVRKIGKCGISFIHGGFLHFGTSCSVAMPSLLGGSKSVRGSVCDCRHITGAVHDVDLKFNEEIDLRQFVAEEDFAHVSAQTIDPAVLTGNVLLLDDQEVECELLKHFLKDTKINLVTFTDPGRAIDEVKRRAFALVLCDLDLDTMSGAEVVKAMRAANFSEPIIVLTGETNPTHLRKAEEAGASAFIKKPYERDMILVTLCKHLNGALNAEDSKPIYSHLIGKSNMSNLINAYMSHVAQSVHEMSKFMVEDNFSAVRHLCLSLRETGTSYGFEPLSECALEALKALDSSSSIAESIDQLQQLKALSKRIQPGQPPPAA